MAIYQVDAFTSKAYHGNPTGVVVNAGRLTDDQKQNFAREINLSITAFIDKSDEADFNIRFFSPRKEVPLSCHSIIASFWVLTTIGRIKPSNDCDVVTVETKKGIYQIELHWAQRKIDKIFMIQDKPTFSDSSIDKQKLAKILGVRQDKIENNDKLPLTIASTGMAKLLVLISSKEMTDALVPRFDDLERLCQRLKVTGIHLYTFDTYSEGSNFYTRHFQPVAGLAETPVSGMANGALAAFLVKKGFAQPGKLIIEQGESLQRQTSLEAIIKMSEDNVVEQVKVGGKAKLIYKLNLLEKI
jgi:PhzF family phenazine biosynthesis protein